MSRKFKAKPTRKIRKFYCHRCHKTHLIADGMISHANGTYSCLPCANDDKLAGAKLLTKLAGLLLVLATILLLVILPFIMEVVK